MAAFSLFPKASVQLSLPLMLPDIIIKGKSILFTPLTGTFSFARPGSIAFHGTADPWAETDSIRTLAEQKEVPLFLTPNANHSLETGDVQADLSIIKATMEHVNRFIATP